MSCKECCSWLLETLVLWALSIFQCPVMLFEEVWRMRCCSVMPAFTLTLSVLFNSVKGKITMCMASATFWGLCSQAKFGCGNNAISSCWPFGDLLVSCLWTKFDVISPRLWQVQPCWRPIWWCVVSLSSVPPLYRFPLHWNTAMLIHAYICAFCPLRTVLVACLSFTDESC